MRKENRTKFAVVHAMKISEARGARYFKRLQREAGGVRFILLLLLAALCLTTACISKGEISCAGASAGFDYIFDGLEVRNGRFEIVSQALAPSQSLWIRRGDQLVAKWDTFSLLINQSGQNCNFNTLLANTPQCQKCDFCQSNSVCGRPGASLVFDPPPQATLTHFEGLMPQGALSTDGLPFAKSGCPIPSNDFPPFQFTPGSDATYRLFFNLPSCSSPGTPAPPLFESQVHVVDSSTQTVRYPLVFRPGDSAPTGANPVAFYQGAIPLAGNRLQENFSANLQVNTVRVLVKGTNTLVKPSRISFIPNFSEQMLLSDQTNQAVRDQRACSGKISQNTLDGAFDLTQCSHNFNVVNPSGTNPCGRGLTAQTNFDLTPSHFNFAQLTDNLTWIVEFRSIDCGVIPDPATELEIEFTLKAK